MFTAYNDKGYRAQIYNTKELEEMVHNSMNYYESKNKALEERVRLLEEDAKGWIDEKMKCENESLKRRLAMSYGEFASQKEKDAYINFTERHMHNRMTSRANGGKAPYLIPTGTGIGTILHVKCPICGEEEDITDDEVW